MGRVVLVDDLAHDLFQHVFDGHQPGNAAVFVQHDDHVVAAPLQFLQQGVDGLRLRHEHRLAQELRSTARPACRARGPARAAGPWCAGCRGCRRGCGRRRESACGRNRSTSWSISSHGHEAGIETMSVRGVMICDTSTSPSSITPSIISRASSSSSPSRCPSETMVRMSSSNDSSSGTGRSRPARRCRATSTIRAASTSGDEQQGSVPKDAARRKRETDRPRAGRRSRGARICRQAATAGRPETAPVPTADQNRPPS